MLSSRPVALTTDGHPMYTKTPGRSLLKGRGNLQENTLHRPTTGKANKASLQTPFHDADIQPTKLFQGVQPGKSTTATTATTALARPLGDKTPFHNRGRNVSLATPAPVGKMGSYLVAETPGYLLRPSSTRKSVRARRSSGPCFQTPITNGNHWDVSAGDIEVEDAQEEAEAAPVLDYDEIEYMPPTAIARPYEPAFDMPDYKAVGRQLFDMMHSYPCDDRLDRYYAAEKDRMDEGLLAATGYADASSQWDLLPLPALQTDDPFAAPAGPSAPPPHRQMRAPAKPIAHSRAPSTFSSRPASTAYASRPGTSASARRAPLSRTASPPAARANRTAIPAPTLSKSTAPRSTSGAAKSASTRPATNMSTTAPRPITSTAFRPITSTASRPTPSTSRAPLKPTPTVAAPNRPATAASVRAIPARPQPLARPATSTATRRPLATSRPNGPAGSSLATARKGAVPEDVVLTFDDGGSVDDGFVFDV